MNPTEYELFVKELHSRLIEKQNHKNILVQHNIKIQGKSGSTHQIDVYWNNNIAGINQHYCVECKYWKSEVKKTHIASFITILNDIGGARGIFVTSKGFQKGAKQLAQQNDIILITANLIKKQYPAQLMLSIPSFENIKLNFVQPENKEKAAILYNWLSLDRNSVVFYDKNGVQTHNFPECLNDMHHEADGYFVENILGNFIKIENELFEADNIEYLYKNNYKEELTLNGYSEVAKAVANYILSEEMIEMQL